MIYAPIIIPTLNRKEHLQRCITSLQKNSWAKYTTLVIGVDYPPSEKYRTGYDEVCDYLREEIAGFEHVEIIYHQVNLGPYENGIFLKKFVRELSDRYIFTEDDNEMSPNFIEYIDKGLELFIDTENVIAICSTGVENENETADENVVLTHNYSAHGYGTWFEKEDLFASQITRDYFEKLSNNTRKLLMLYRYDPSLIFACQSAVFRKENLYRLPDGSIPILDMTIKIYSVLEDKYVVCPCNRKSRNWGYDGSGVNCSNIRQKAAEIQIDERQAFLFKYKKHMRVSKVRQRPSVEIKIRILAALCRLKFRNVWRK